MNNSMRHVLTRIGVVTWAAVMTAGLMIAPADAASDAKGPGCTDIVDGGGDWDGATGTLTFGVGLAKPACKTVTYTLYAAIDQNGTPTGTVYSSTSYTVNASGQLVFTLNVPDPDPDPSAGRCTAIVDVYATTAIKHRVIDRAPDTGYAQFFDNVDLCGSPSRDFH